MRKLVEDKAETNHALIRSWYVSAPRLLELLNSQPFPSHIQHALQTPSSVDSRSSLANLLGPHLLDFINAEGILPFHRLAIEDKLRPGVRFTYHGHFYGKGFGLSSKSPLVSLSEDVNEFLPGKKVTHRVLE